VHPYLNLNLNPDSEFNSRARRDRKQPERGKAYDDNILFALGKYLSIDGIYKSLHYHLVFFKRSELTRIN